MNLHPIHLNNQPAIKIGRIQYVNVDPVYYGFDNDFIYDNLEIIRRPPSSLNKMLADGELDISSVSSSAFARNSHQWLILPDLSISCFGRVMSVLLVSRYPLSGLDKKMVLLTDESSTAVDLLKLLFSANDIKPIFRTGKVGTPADLMHTAGAGLVIGDAALKHQWGNHFPYVLDLCEMWNSMTGLPFVFGVWAVRKTFAEKYPQIVSSVTDLFIQSRYHGMKHIDEIIRSSAEKLDIEEKVSKAYYEGMYYSFSDQEYKSLKEFFDGLYSHRIIDQKPSISFFHGISDNPVINAALS